MTQPSHRPATRKRWGAVAALTAAGLLLSACSSGGTHASSSAVGSRGASITYVDTIAPRTFDPVDADNNAAGFNIELTYANVLEFGSDGRLVAGLADKWGYVGTGNTQFEYTLKSGLKFADGTPITAQAAVNSFDHFLTGTGPGVSALKGATATAVDGLTVKITTQSPNPAIPDLLGPNYFAGALISPAGLANPKAMSTTSYGAGPYVLDTSKTVLNSVYYYKRNPSYWNGGSIHYNQFVIRIIPNTQSAFQSIESGQSDFMRITSSDLATKAKSAGLNVTVKGSFAWDGLQIADQAGKLTPAFANEKVRQALNYALDRATLAKTFFGNLGTPTSNPSQPGYGSYAASNDTYYTYDPAKAKQLLTEAGYPHGFTFTMTYIADGGSMEQLIEASAQQLAKVGITEKLNPTTGITGIQQFFAGKVAAISIPETNYVPWLLYAQNWLPGGSLNPLQVSNPAITNAYNAASKLTGSAADQAWQNLTTRLVQTAWTVPIVRYQTAWVTDKKVAGIQINPVTGLLDFTKVRPTS